MAQAARRAGGSGHPRRAAKRAPGSGALLRVGEGFRIPTPLDPSPAWPGCTSMPTFPRSQRCFSTRETSARSCGEGSMSISFFIRALRSR